MSGYSSITKLHYNLRDENSFFRFWVDNINDGDAFLRTPICAAIKRYDIYIFCNLGFT